MFGFAPKLGVGWIRMCGVGGFRHPGWGGLCEPRAQGERRVRCALNPAQHGARWRGDLQ